MPCYHPLRGYRDPNGTVTLGREPPGAAVLPIPCGGCIGCKKNNAQAWALRCHLEQQLHDNTAFATLTYDEERCPPSLDKRHLQLFYKRLRKHADRRLRHFSCGEYGEQTHRPHYHAILFGLSKDDAGLVSHAWGQGFTECVDATPAAINYVAGYVAKKYGDWAYSQEERIDYETGEVFNWQPPFIQMSRGGRQAKGIGAHAKQWTESWRSHAVLNGHAIKVPRYLHEAWLKTATEGDIEQLKSERLKLALERDNSERGQLGRHTKERLRAAELIALAQQRQKAARRTKV